MSLPAAQVHKIFFALHLPRSHAQVAVKQRLFYFCALSHVSPAAPVSCCPPAPPPAAPWPRPAAPAAAAGPPCTRGSEPARRHWAATLPPCVPAPQPAGDRQIRGPVKAALWQAAHVRWAAVLPFCVPVPLPAGEWQITTTSQAAGCICVMGCRVLPLCLPLFLCTCKGRENLAYKGIDLAACLCWPA